jgi:hypothetical protein
MRAQPGRPTNSVADRVVKKPSATHILRAIESIRMADDAGTLPIVLRDSFNPAARRPFGSR